MNTDIDREVEWFAQEGYGADRIEESCRRPLVISLLKLSLQVGFDFCAEVLRASAWAAGHAPKRRWDRFYLNWFRRAQADGRQGDKEFEKDVERFK